MRHGSTTPSTTAVTAPMTGATATARTGRVLGAALPPLLLAGLGSAHPHVLTPESATWWRDLHIVGLILFPLLAVPPWLVVRGRGRRLEVLVLVLGLVYASFYTALDAIAGIGGGAATLAAGPGPWVSSLFGIADLVALPGVYAYLAATVLAAVVGTIAAPGAWRALAAVGGLIAIVGAYWFLSSHIYYPLGVATMVTLAVGHTALVVAAGRPAIATGARHATPVA